MSGNFSGIAGALLIILAAAGPSEAGANATLIGTWKIHVKCRTLSRSGNSLKGSFVSNGAYEGENNGRYTGSRL